VRPGSPPAPLPVAPPASVPPPTAAKAEPAPPPTPEPARPAAAPPGPEPGAKKAEPPAIEPAPAKAPPVRGDERWLLAQPPGHHTVQLFGSHDEKAAARFRDAQTLKDRVALYRTRRDGKDWYVVVVGSFATREAAQRAIQGLPAPLKRNNPWPRTLESVQTSIREAGTP
jgi:DamX protein